jgi:glyoxylate reductase
MRPAVLVTRALPEEWLAPLRAAAQPAVVEADRTISAAALRERIAPFEGLLCFPGDPVDRSVIEAAPRLRAIATVSVGYDHVDVAAARERGIGVAHTPGVLTEATAELTFALLRAAARRVVEGDALVRSGAWTGWGPAQLLGKELAGATLAVIGPGRIGGAVARRARAFDMRVLYVGRRAHPDLDALGCAPAPLERALEEADFVSLHVPLEPATRHLIGAAELARMKPDAVLVNTARGPVVDEAALARALAERRIGGAGLDVYEREPEVPAALRALPNVVLLPHIGSATRATRARMAAAAIAGLLALLRGERAEHEVAGAGA